MTECDIQAVLGCRYGVDKGQIVIPNVLLGSYEADFITITKSDYLIEVEIKISISDFRADFKKKHYHDAKKLMLCTTLFLQSCTKSTKKR